jgi:hypothetical protein
MRQKAPKLWFLGAAPYRNAFPGIKLPILSQNTPGNNRLKPDPAKGYHRFNMWNQTERRSTVFIFSNLNGLARYFGRVMPTPVIQDEVQAATRDFRLRQFANPDQSQLEFIKLCETRLVKKAKELQLEI